MLVIVETHCNIVILYVFAILYYKAFWKYYFPSFRRILFSGNTIIILEQICCSFGSSPGPK